METVREIAVISDTHGLLRPEAAKILSSADMILHAGDIDSHDVLNALGNLARTSAVRGNCDGDWAEDIPGEALLELYGSKIYMVHNKKNISLLAGRADIIIYGHSHKYEAARKDGRLWLNPGSAGPRRRGRPATMAMLCLGETTGDISVRRIELADGGASVKDDGNAFRESSTGFCPPDLQARMPSVIRDLKKGKTLEDITKTYGIGRGTAEQICQIYFTHPGIDARGVLDRMEIAGK